jgi:hypothetical protein
MRLQRWFSWLGVGTLVLSGMLMTGPLASAQDATPPAAQTAAQAGDNGTSVVGTPLLSPAIDMIRAQEIALEGQAGAAVTDVELSGENGVLVYSVDLDTGVGVEVDATSGEVISTEQQDGEQDEDNAEDDENGDRNDNGGNEEDEDEDDEQRDDDGENGEES